MRETLGLLRFGGPAVLAVGLGLLLLSVVSWRWER